MSETLEKEVLEAEKNGTVFETKMFDHIYSEVSAVKDEMRQELQTVLLDGLRKFVEKKINNTEPINWEAVEIAFFAAVAISLGGDYCKKNREESMVATVKKRVIRKENLIGFNVILEGEDKPTAGTVIPKEQYDELILSGKTMLEIVKSALPDDQKIKDVYLMSPAELDKILELSADAMLKGEGEE